MRKTTNAHSSGSATPTFNVWVVDDSPAERDLLKRQTERILEYLGVVNIKTDEFDALKLPYDLLYDGGRPDLIVTDLRLPDECAPADWQPRKYGENRNGGILVTIATERNIPVVIVTGQHRPGANFNVPLVKKPSRLDDLSAAVGKALGFPRRVLDTDLQSTDNGDTLRISRQFRVLLKFHSLSRAVLLNALAQPDQRLATAELAEQTGMTSNQVTKTVTSINAAFAKAGLPLRVCAPRGSGSPGYALVAAPETPPAAGKARATRRLAGSIAP